MLRKLRERAQDEKGFTLIELLVVILIIGILAAIAIPSFLNQRQKGTDAEAKTQVTTASQAMETCATDNNGSYTSCDKTALTTIEPTLADLGSRLPEPVLGNSAYTVTVESARAPAEVTFTVKRRSNGMVDRLCDVGTQPKGGCLVPGGPGPDW